MSKTEVKINGKQIVNRLLQIGSSLLFGASIIVLSYMSFVDNFEIQPNWQTLTTVGLVTLVMNWLIWDTNYKTQYEKLIRLDKSDKLYSIHKRYYEARRDWKYNDLQAKIQEYNKHFVDTWKKDVEQIMGMTIEQIENSSYKKMPHKYLMYRVKHKKYPSSGIKTPRDMLYILSVGKTDSMKVKIKAEENYHTIGRLKKVITSALGAVLSASFVFEFITGNWIDVVLRIIISVVCLFMSFFFGALSGQTGAKLKLSVAEEVSERLEEWKNSKPTQEPYADLQEEHVIVKKEENIPTIEIT